MSDTATLRVQPFRSCEFIFMATILTLYAVMITLFSYQITYIITCCRSDVDGFLTITPILFTPNYTYSLLYHKIKHLLHIHHSHNIKKRSPHRFSPGRRPHRFLQRDHCICSLFCNGNGVSVSIPTTGTGLRSLFRPYIHLLYFNYA